MSLSTRSPASPQTFAPKKLLVTSPDPSPQTRGTHQEYLLTAASQAATTQKTQKTSQQKTTKRQVVKVQQWTGPQCWTLMCLTFRSFLVVAIVAETDTIAAIGTATASPKQQTNIAARERNKQTKRLDH